MTWRTHPLLILLRAIGRRTGLNPLLSPLVSRAGYETRFQEEVIGGVHRDDCVWDIGANIGFYTALFSDAVGEKGRVVAFEPSPLNHQQLQEAMKGRRNISLLPWALGDLDGTVSFQQGEDDLGATSRVVSNSVENEPGGESVRVVRGDDLVHRGDVPPPNVVKIDTEGWELHVLRGMKDILKSPALRLLCIEVHFGLLAQQGTGGGPREVESILHEAGFGIKWPDPSHIVASRTRP